MDFPKVDLAQFLPAGAGHHGHHGIESKDLRDPFSSFEGEVERDVVKVSAQARQLAASAEDGDDDVDDIGGSLLGSAKGLIHSALNSISKDLSNVLKAFGFDSDIAKEFAKAFVQPVVDALKEGIDFSAKLTLAAFSQETVISGSETSQSTQLIAKSIEIEVNNSTGEVSVAVASLSIEENIHIDFGGGLFDGPLFPVNDPAIEPPVDGTDAAPIVDVPATEAPAETEPVAAAASSGAVAASIFVKEAVEALVVEQITLQSRITLRAFEQYNNEDGQLISKFRFDAAFSITALLEGAEAGEHHGHDDDNDDDHQNTIAITA